MAYEPNLLHITTNLRENQTLGYDNFTFKVFDSKNNFSLAAMVEITIVTGVSATGLNRSHVLYEGEESELPIYGTAKDDSQGHLSFHITGLPVYGSVLNANNFSPVEVGSIYSVSYPYHDGIGLIYRPPAENFFTSPASQWNGAVILPSVQGSELVTWYTTIELGSATISSTEATVDIVVVNVNDNSNFSCDGSVREVLASMDLLDDSDTTRRPDRLVLDNFSIFEVDQGVDPIRVNIEAGNGVVSLNVDALNTSLLSFDADCSGTHKWICFGDGRMQRRMTFVGAPTDVLNALNGMRYVNNRDNLTDTVTISTYDGAGDTCIHQFASNSLRSFCTKITCVIRVNVGEYFYQWEKVDQPATITVHYTVALGLLAILIGCCWLAVYQFGKLLCFVLLFFCRIPKVLRTCKNWRRNILCCYRGQGKLEAESGRQRQHWGVVDQQCKPQSIGTSRLKHVGIAEPKAPRVTSAKVPLGRGKNTAVLDEHRGVAKRSSPARVESLQRYRFRPGRRAIAVDRNIEHEPIVKAQGVIPKPRVSSLWEDD